MKIKTSIQVAGLAVVGLLVSLAGTARAGDNLEAHFKATGWDKLIGTWVDANGTETTFGWKYPGSVVQSITRMGDVERISLIVKNPETGDSYVFSVDNMGGSSHGTCEFTEGTAVFNISFNDHKGNSGSFDITYKLIDEGNMEVHVGGQPEPLKLTKK